jgi:RNA polymerase sigma-B factor
MPTLPPAHDDCPSVPAAPVPGDEGLDRLTDGELGGVLADPQRREAAREVLVGRYGWLVRAQVFQYQLPAQHREDLIQAGYVGLLKAVNNFDPLVRDSLLYYARVCISGEIKRYFRDKRWMLKVRRADQELRLRARRAREDLARESGHMPADAEVAQQLDVSVPDLTAADLAADAFAPASLDAPVSAENDALALGEFLGAEDPGFQHAVDMAAVAAHWPGLPVCEQRVLVLRFFGGKSQAEVARELGCSQMHVSRLQARALRYLRHQLLADMPA